MIKFKGIRGGTILLGAACIILGVVIAIILLSVIRDNAAPASGEIPAVMAAAQNNDGLYFDPYAIPEENEHTDETVSLDIVSESIPIKNGKRILIYHTHTHEAYEMAENNEYEPLENWRTDDNDHNIVRVGSELSRLLRTKGFEVVHDTTDNEMTELSTAYQRSLDTLSNYTGQEFDLYIDLHRDAHTQGTTLTCNYRGDDAARLMMLVGKGENFAEKPFFDENYSVACRLTDAINSICPGMCRDVLVKTGRYNQHIAPASILVEAGSNMNTLEEVLSAMPVLAEAIDITLNESTGIVTLSDVPSER